MQTNTPLSPPALISQPKLCDLIGKSRSGLGKIRKRDPSFPKPIKDGSCRQAACYYVVAEVDAWIAARIAARDASTGSAPQ